MENRRKSQGETHCANDHQGGRPCYSKPPWGDRQSYVPSWEKKFCSSVGSVSWGKLLEAQRYMYLHDNVIQWDDSACKEAFNNAKSRFWAEFNGRPCNLSLPDPNIYIDEVDWDSSIDPELLLDLEKERNARISKLAENDEAKIFSDTLQLNQSVACTGWGDAEADLSNINQALILGDILQLNQSFACTGWGDAEAALSNDKYNVNQWEDCIQKNDVLKEYEWGNVWNGWSLCPWEDYPNDNQLKMEGRADGNWGTWHYCPKNENRLGCHAPHTKPSNAPYDDSMRSRRLRSGRRRHVVDRSVARTLSAAK